MKQRIFYRVKVQYPDSDKYWLGAKFSSREKAKKHADTIRNASVVMCVPINTRRRNEGDYYR